MDRLRVLIVIAVVAAAAAVLSCRTTPSASPPSKPADSALQAAPHAAPSKPVERPSTPQRTAAPARLPRVRRAPLPPPPADPRPLADRPLYTFDESELGAYLRTLAATTPLVTDRIVHLARKALGQPYEIYLLGEFPIELHDADPLYNLARSDCLTFAEHIYAMALSDDFDTFLRTLQRLRYRDGVVGMLTRNHYTEADWNPNNAFAFEDLTATLAGGRAAAPMTATVRRAEFFRKFGIGEDVPVEEFRDHYIPSANLPLVAAELRDGDFVNIVRGNAESQWVGHVGFVVRGADGGVNFLHSAAPAVREQPLADYLAKDRRCVGVKFLRLRTDARERMAAALSAGGATDVSAAALRDALARSPLMVTGAPDNYAEDWVRAMKLQGYRLEIDTPTEPSLQAELEALDQRVAAELGIAVDDRAVGIVDLHAFRFAAVRPDALFYGASVPKIAIVLGYFEQHPHAAAALAPDIERELQLVLKRSDNELAAKYSQLVGLDALQSLLRSDRYHLYDEKTGGGLWCGKHYGVDQPRVGDPVGGHSHAATVRQCLRYYLMLEQGRLINPAASARIKQLFAAPELEFHGHNFVAGLAGRDVAVLRKSGTWEDWHLDTARVQHGERLYLLAGMTHHPAGETYLARMAAGIDEILCGTTPMRPHRHELYLFDASDLLARLVSGGASGDAGTDDAAAGARAVASTHESQVIATQERFNEAVVSWNIDVPPAAGFVVEARVGRSWEERWSPWLYFGDGGAALPGDVERVTKFEFGRIDVDYFRSDERFDRVQVRVRATNATPVIVARLAICASDTTGLPPAISTPPSAAPPPVVGHWRRRLPVPFRSQRAERPEIAGRICSPTSLAMLLEYRGFPHPTQTVADAVFDAANSIYGNWPRNVQAAYALGAPGYLARFSDWRAVEQSIADDQPLIISIRVPHEGGLRGAPYKTTDGHLLVLCGFDADGRVEVNDPAVAAGADGRLKYHREDLEECWMRATGGLAYVVLPAQRRGAAAE
ncbi:MAG: N-acetylmuramoyl-L-alanine amidase-like domain-containing protein [Phycisphaerae bacterium]